MTHTIIVAQKVVHQLRRDKRFLALSIVAPLIIIFFLKLFFDTMADGFPVERYVVPIAGFLVYFFAFLLCAMVLVQERSQGTLERMFVSGFHKRSIISGYVIGYLGLATLQAAVALGEALLLFHLDYSAQTILSLFLPIWLLAIDSVMLGILVSTFARSEAQVFPFIPLFILPSIFLSGLLIDNDRLPVWADWLGHIFPVYYAFDIIKGIVLRGEMFVDHWSNIAILVGYALVLLFLASATLKDVE
ncbi:MAG: ABC transporter permease [Candidatus Kerfeldbacteria bacterium]|nr:ABC transporter permease [Candidatus Kerfeldbacteria bacterium]